jgi:hypothetical protein
MPPRPVHNDGIPLETVFVQVLPPVENERTVFYFIFLKVFLFNTDINDTKPTVPLPLYLPLV